MLAAASAISRRGVREVRKPGPGAMALVGLLLIGYAASPAARHQGASADAPAAPLWSYSGEHGPARWGELAPAYAPCKHGRNQSPIDIRNSRFARLPALSFHYRSNALSIANNGRNIQVDYAPGSYMRVDGKRYELKYFDFHSPSEHQFNGRAADMVMHLVHRGTAGQWVVVAVPVKSGRRLNSTLTRIWDHMPERPGEEFYGRQVGINATFLLPSDRSYLTYMGSLTTPPCQEGVRWILLRNAVELDASYVSKFRRVIGANARPVQPLNGRQVIAAARR